MRLRRRSDREGGCFVISWRLAIDLPKVMHLL
jgi:hypothetical protein